MKKIGVVTSQSKKGTILVQAKKTYRLNSKIVNQEIKHIGKIVDIIGPEKKPYLVINTRNAEATAKKGDVLYLLDKPLRSKRKSSYKSKSYQKRRKH